MIEAGMDVARLGLAHGTLEEGLARLRLVRSIAKDMGRTVGVLADLPGPKPRVAGITDVLHLDAGAPTRLVVGEGASTPDTLNIGYDQLLDDLRPGDELGFGSGIVRIVVESVDLDSVRATVLHGGELTGRPGMHIPSNRLSALSPTDADLRLLDAFVEEEVDMVAVSFVRSAHELSRVGTEPHPRGPLIVTKIESRQAIENLDAIISASAAVMIARGDLGSEFPVEELPILQKQVIEKCIAAGLPVMTATQMLESMVTSPMPTRAEASDVANAVFDGSSAVMLSAETAIGLHPAQVVSVMSELAEKADDAFDHGKWFQGITARRASEPTGEIARVTDAMTGAALHVSEQLGLTALICISGSGFTVRSMARFRPSSAILGFSSDARTVSQLSLSWGVTPMLLTESGDYEQRVNAAVAQAVATKAIASGDLVGVLAGIDTRLRTTDVLRIVQVP